MLPKILATPDASDPSYTATKLPRIRKLKSKSKNAQKKVSVIDQANEHGGTSSRRGAAGSRLSLKSKGSKEKLAKLPKKVQLS